MSPARGGVVAAAGLVLLLGACSVRTPPPEVTGNISSSASPENLIYCFAHSCARQQKVIFTPDQWGQVRAIFAERAADVGQERQRIRRAVGLMERVAAAQAGTEDDVAGTTPFFFQGSRPPQLDCYDEAINTSNFLGLMVRDGLLRHHRVRAPVQRWFIGGDYIHATAVIEESNGGALYAVDSSFHDNGEDAETPPLDAWLAGWGLDNQDPVLTSASAQ